MSNSKMTVVGDALNPDELVFPDGERLILGKKVRPAAPVQRVLVDLPWNFSQYRKAANGAVQYPTMTIADMCKIPVASWCAENCVIAFWCVGTKVAEGAHKVVLDAWGFTPKTMIPWIKNSPSTADLATNMGIWFMGNAEYLIFATRGKVGGFFEKLPGEAKPRKLRGGNLGVLVGDRDSPHFWQRVSERVLLAPKDSKHSRKPVTLIEYLESFEGAAGLELFARDARPGWLGWGHDMGHALGAWGCKRIAQRIPAPEVESE